MRPPAYSLRRFAKPAGVLARAGLALLALAGSIPAQTALEPEQGGTDYKIQGEYSGTVAGAPMGAQVVALGAGRFKAVYYPGGLPGDGWNGTGRKEAAGELADGEAAFAGGGYTAAIDTNGSRLTGKTDKGDTFTFDKIMRLSPEAGATPPAGALVLFDGNGVSAWKDGTAGMDKRKLFKPEGATAAAGAVTRQAFQDFTLHLEFREPFMPSARGTQRGNSGIYLQGRYEIQVLDSFGSDVAAGADTMAPKRECGAIWEHFGPKVNMSYPPLSWQTYDIAFTAARFDASGNRVAPAQATLRWNGAVAHDKQAMLNRTLAGDLESASPGPLRFQGYGDSVYYRNIWIVEGTAAIRPRKWESKRRGVLERAEGADRIVLADGRALSPAHRDAILAGASADGGLRRKRPARAGYFISSPMGNGAFSHPRRDTHEF